MLCQSASRLFNACRPRDSRTGWTTHVAVGHEAAAGTKTCRCPAVEWPPCDDFSSRVRSISVSPGQGLARDTDSKETTVPINVDPAVTPHLVVGDAPAAIDFYVKAF